MIVDPRFLKPSLWGFPEQRADPINPMGGPVGDGRVPVPHWTAFQSIFNTFSQSYRWFNGDEALRDSIANSRAMKRDPVIFSALRARQKPTALLQGHIEPFDPTNQLEVEAAKLIEDVIKHGPSFQQLKMWLLEAIWQGRYGVQVAYEWSWKFGGRQMMIPRQYFPVNGDKLVFKYDRSVGIRVHSSYNDPKKQDRYTFSDYGKVYWFDNNERESLIVHEFEPEDAVFEEAELAGSLFGVGMRSRLYYAWALKNQLQGILYDYLNWFARGLTIYYYEAGNNDALSEVTTRVTQYAGQPFMVFPRFKDGGPNYKPVERFEPGTASASLIENLATDYYDSLIYRAFLDQTLSSSTGATGMGSGVAELHQSSFDQVVKYDSNALADTLNRDLFSVLYRVNFPGMVPGRWVFEIDTPNVEEIISGANAFYSWGGAIDETSMRETLGLPGPTPNGTILSKVQSMQPAATEGLPTGVPVVQGAPVDANQPEYSAGSVDVQQQVQAAPG